MKRIYVALLCLSLLSSASPARAAGEGPSTDPLPFAMPPAPTIPPALADRHLYNWNDGSMRRESGIFTYQILDEAKKEAAIIRVNGAVRDLAVPTGLDGYRIRGIGQMALQNWTSGFLTFTNVVEFDIDVGVSDLLGDTLETLTVPDGIEYIGYSAFSGCRRLARVELPPDLHHIADRAFAGCTSLRELHVSPGYVMSEGRGVDIRKGAFAGCRIGRVTFEAPTFRGFYRSHVEDLVARNYPQKALLLKVDRTTIDRLRVDPEMSAVYFRCETKYPDGRNGAIGKIMVNGRDTRLYRPDSGIALGTLYTVPKARCIGWARKYRIAYKTKSCGRMGTVTREGGNATWRPVSTTVRTYSYDGKKKRWTAASRRARTYYNVYGRNGDSGRYKLVTTTAKTSCTQEYKYLKVRPVATWG